MNRANGNRLPQETRILGLMPGIRLDSHKGLTSIIVTQAAIGHYGYDFPVDVLDRKARGILEMTSDCRGHGGYTEPQLRSVRSSTSGK